METVYTNNSKQKMKALIKELMHNSLISVQINSRGSFKKSFDSFSKLYLGERQFLAEPLHEFQGLYKHF